MRRRVEDSEMFSLTAQDADGQSEYEAEAAQDAKKKG